MRTLFIAATIVFWIAIAGFWAAGAWAPQPAPSAAPPVAATDRAFTLAEIARHAAANDCWMAIDGQVYDFTPYVDLHPSEPEIFLPWCGKEASEAYRTKTKGRPHSARADGLLPRYRIGVLQAAR